MSRLGEAFRKGKVFIGFLTAGDPSLEKTEEYIMEMTRAGAGIIEIGIPFSDPIAEGTVIQAANIRALSNPYGCTTDQVFEMVANVRKKTEVPLVLLTYLNPVFKYGYQKFCSHCYSVGVDGIIIPDMPYEEKQELAPVAMQYDIDLISLIAPTSADRITMIAKEAVGYIYVVSSMGVTGVRTEITTDVASIIQIIRNVTDTPTAIGFGINTPEQAAKYSLEADGIIVGSAIVRLIASMGANAKEAIYEYVKNMVEEMH